MALNPPAAPAPTARSHASLWQRHRQAAPKPLKKLGSAPAPGVAVDALVRRREQRSASLGCFLLHQSPPGVPASFCLPASPALAHFPKQNWLKIESSKSSVVVLPTISPTALTAMRSSAAASSRVSSAFSTPTVRCVASRARPSAS